MTREELRDYVEEQRSLNNIPYHVYSELIDGIDTLEQEPICPSHGIDCEDCPAYDPCGDAISRQAVCKIIDDIRQKIDGLRYDHFIGNVSNYAVIDTALEIIDAHIAEE